MAVAAAIGVSYPSLVGIVAAGVLTFTAARVFADGAVVDCSSEAITDCRNRPEGTQCDSCGTVCKCGPSSCSEAGAAPAPANGCVPVVDLCGYTRFMDCADKTEGAACGTNGECKPGACDALDASTSTFAGRTALVCTPKPAPVNPAGDASADGAPAPPARPNLDETAGGCSTTPATTTPAMLGAVAALSIALLWRARQRRKDGRD